MISELYIGLPFAFLCAGIGAGAMKVKPERMLVVPVVSSALVIFASVAAGMAVASAGPISVFGNVLRLDTLAVYHVLLVDVVFLLASIYASGYFRRHIVAGRLNASYIRRYILLWQAFHGMLLLVLLSNHIGLTWVAFEATTLVSAFLILSDSEPLSIEAMWKYLLICSVGITFAFMGTMLTVAAARGSGSSEPSFLFSELALHRGRIDPKLMLFAFILIVVGFGTKAGLAPMHTWLPDAHSQAPTPVSAVFSGVMLNCALFCIMRYLPIAEAALGKDGQARSILLLFGFMSLVFAVVFIPIQHDMKRLLAYHSVEHLGIIAVGLGIGGLGTFAALLHTTNHSISKMLAFFSAGHISEYYGTRDMRRISAAVHQMPWWGGAFFVSILVLIGVAPFSVFMSELLIAKEAFFTGRYMVFSLFILMALAVFVSALKHALDVSFGEYSSSGSTRENVRPTDKVIIVFCIAALLLLGLWIPLPLMDFLKDAAAIVENGAPL